MSTVADAGLLDRENPWPGLLAFSEEGREFFNGREDECDELFRLIRRERLTLLYGHSGLGKTSLLNAGLFPLLRSENLLPVSVRIDHRPDSPPADAQMLERLLVECRAHGIEAPAVTAGQTLWEYLHLKDAAFWSAKNHPVTPVFVLDQFEEVFTLGRASPHGSRDFLTSLGHLINNEIPGPLQERLNADPAEAGRYAFRRQDYRIVISLREDFLPDLEHQLRDVVRAPTQNSVRLRRMSGRQAHDALLATGGHLLAPDVAPLIIQFLAARGESGHDGDLSMADLEVEPALLSVFARELNERRKARGLEQVEAGLLQGSKSEILSAFYENSLAGLHPEVRVFVEEKLLTDSGFRDSAAVEDALRRPGITPAALDALIDQRILRREERFGTQRLELTHDVLTKIVRESRDRRRREEEQAERQAREAAERQRMRKRTRQMAAVALGLLLAGLVSSGFAVTAFRAERRAKAEREQAQQERDRAREATQRATSARDSERAALREAERERQAAVELAEARERALAEAAAERDNARLARVAAERLRTLAVDRAARLETLLPRPEKLSDIPDLDVESAPPLVAGSTVVERLGGDGLRYANRPFAAWAYQGEAGEIVRFDLRSSAFDAYLYLFDAESDDLLCENDDGGAGLDSQIGMRLPGTGRYVIVASTYDRNAEGEYELSAAEGSDADLLGCDLQAPSHPERLADLGGDARSAPPGAQPIDRTSPRQGGLGPTSATFNGRRFEAWLYDGEVGEQIRIEQRSAEFDSFLQLFDLESGELLARDDDGGTGQDARIESQLPRTGTYVIVASSFGPASEGSYELSVRDLFDPPTDPDPGADRPLHLEDLGIAGAIVPAEAREIVLNTAVEARLDGSSPSFGERRYGVWAFHGSGDEIVRIDHRSDDFDAFLYLFDLETGELVDFNDDGDGPHSRILVRLPHTGTYLIVASSYETEATGSYELSVNDLLAPPPNPQPGIDRPVRLSDLDVSGPGIPAAAGRILPDGTVEGRLDDSSPVFGGRRYAIWALDVSTGEVVRIDLRSNDFDPFLYLFDLRTGELLHFNDDVEDASGVDSRIEVRLPDAGTYLIVASSFDPDEAGQYELEVRAIGGSD